MHKLCTLLVLLLSSATLAAERPNFVWLLSEDNSIHYLKLYDVHGAETPRIFELAAHGLTFNHAFSNAPVCSVARTTLITGCYGPRIGTQFHRRAVSAHMPEGLKMFPAYLRDSGYYTTNNQKKDYNADETPGTWDESSRTASWRNRQSGQPFFHMQSFTTTHESSLHFSKEVFETQTTTTDPNSVHVFPYHPDTPLFRYTVARYHDRMRQVDSEIGEVVDQLQADGLLEETFIFYFGDHGGVLPRGKGYAYESGLHVPLVVRVPEKYRHLVAWPAGSGVDGFVSFVDMGPTLWHLAGANAPMHLVDGRAFWGIGITAQEVDKRNSAFGYADRFDEKYDLVRTLRVGDLEYVRNYQPFNFDGLHNNYRYIMLAYQQWRDLYEAGELNDVQSQFFRTREPEALYDLSTDPYEINNLAGNPQHTQQLKELRQLMQLQVKSMPDLSFYPESYLAEHAFQAPVAFGDRHKADIGLLVDTADLSLQEFATAEPKLREALQSDNAWQRYWALIVCSSFAKQATGLGDVARKLAASDKNLLVRVRAAEFLGLAELADPRPTIMDCLTKSQSSIEVGLMLNTVTLLQDGKPGYEFSISKNDLPASSLQDDVVIRRLEYLDSTGLQAKR